jgi:hypothetical protein
MGYPPIGKFDAQGAGAFMSSTWKDLYRTTISDHRSTLDLLTQAMRAAEACNSQVLRAELKTHRVVPVLLLCQELDRFEVPPPELSPGQSLPTKSNAASGSPAVSFRKLRT